MTILDPREVERVARLLHERVWREWIYNLHEQGGLTPAARKALAVADLSYDDLHEYGKERARAFARRLLGDLDAPLPQLDTWTPAYRAEMFR